jgi:hypothetical protein
VLPFDWKQISYDTHNVRILFTKVALIFTIQVPPPAGYQSIFVAPRLKDYENKRNALTGPGLPGDRFDVN